MAENDSYRPGAKKIIENSLVMLTNVDEFDNF